VVTRESGVMRLSHKRDGRICEAVVDRHAVNATKAYTEAHRGKYGENKHRIRVLGRRTVVYVASRRIQTHARHPPYNRYPSFCFDDVMSWILMNAVILPHLHACAFSKCTSHSRE
jgi:hypothetical protein